MMPKNFLIEERDNAINMDDMCVYVSLQKNKKKKKLRATALCIREKFMLGRKTSPVNPCEKSSKNSLFSKRFPKRLSFLPM